MKRLAKPPNLYIIAGPNGSGKTTFARKFLPNYAGCLEFVNADLIAGGLSPFAPERAAMQAGRIMLQQIRILGNRSVDFGFETTLSGRTYVKLLADLKRTGYRIHIFFLWLHSIDLALERITTRVRSGGHDVPKEVVSRRFDKGLYNFFNFYQAMVDSWAIFDNSGDSPRLIAFDESGELTILDSFTYGMLLKYQGT